MMFPILVVLASSLSVQAVEFGASLGAETTVNDPFVVRAGPRASAWISPAPWLDASLDFGIYPDSARPRGLALTQIIYDYRMSPDLSRIVDRTGATVTLYPFRGSFGSWDRRAGLLGGVGLTHTHDDLEAIQAVGNPTFEATMDQWHATIIWGVVGEISSEHLGFRLRISRSDYHEVVGTDVSEVKNPLWVGLEATWRSARPRG